MKRIILFTFLLITLSISAQNDSTNYKANSFLQLSGGIGASYGGGGIKSVLGYKGNGLLVGLGLAKGKFLKQLGLQLSYKWVFLTLTRGDYATYEVYNTDNIALAEGQTFITGGHIDISGTKRIFIELGIGYSWGDRITNQDGEREELTKLAYSAGVIFNI
jgi:hypothetical protein